MISPLLLLASCTEGLESGEPIDTSSESIETSAWEQAEATECLDVLRSANRSSAAKILVDPNRSYLNQEGIATFIAQITEDPESTYSPYKDLKLIAEDANGHARFLATTYLYPNSIEIRALAELGFDVDGEKDFFIKSLAPGFSSVKSLWGTNQVACTQSVTFYSCDQLSFNGDWDICEELTSSSWNASVN